MEYKFKVLIRAAAVSAFVTFLLIWVIYNLIFKKNIDLLDASSYAVSITTILLVFYEKWGWILLSRFNNTPTIYGQYTGTVNYVYKNEPGTKEVKVTIKQTYLTTKVFLQTDEISSSTLTGDIVNENGEEILYYTYLTNPKMQFSEKNPINRGTARLVINDQSLKGIYWTARQTGGDIDLKKAP